MSAYRQPPAAPIACPRGEKPMSPLDVTSCTWVTEGIERKRADATRVEAEREHREHLELERAHDAERREATEAAVARAFDEHGFGGPGPVAPLTKRPAPPPWPEPLATFQQDPNLQRLHALEQTCVELTARVAALEALLRSRP